jgi:hypothetical protein
MRRRVFGSLPVGTDNDRAAVRASGMVDSRQTANLARREADMALRHQPPETGDFYISKAGTFACAVYRRRGADAGAWVTGTESKHYEPARWVQRQIKRRDSRWHCAPIDADAFGSDPRRYRPRRVAAA